MLVQIKACYFDKALDRDVLVGEIFEYADEKRANDLIDAGVAFSPTVQKVEAETGAETKVESKPKTKPKKEVKEDE